MSQNAKHWIVFLVVVVALAAGAAYYYFSTLNSPLEVLNFLNPPSSGESPVLTLVDDVTLVPTGLDVPDGMQRIDDAKGRLLNLPEGFSISVFASGFEKARFMAVDPVSGTLYLSDSSAGKVYALPDRDGDGVADENALVANDMSYPHGLAFRDGWLYIAEKGQVIRTRDTNGDYAADDRENVISNIPSGGNHISRTIMFGPDGKMYLSIGSSCNACEERDERRAAIVRYEPDGSGEKVFAKGLRNSVGIDFHPDTGELWASNNGRDFLGNNLPPEEINIVREDAHYGWPYCYGNRIVDPEFDNRSFCPGTEPPIVEMQAHSAPLGIRFVRSESFPEAFQDNLFVAFHGSWNRSDPTGYKVIRIIDEGDGNYRVSDFATGWLVDDKSWGRPVDVIVGGDGALYISDDTMNVIYRITYESPPAPVPSPTR